MAPGAGVGVVAVGVSAVLLGAVVWLGRQVRRLSSDAQYWRGEAFRLRELQGGTFGGAALEDRGIIFDANPTFRRLFGLEPGARLAADAIEVVAPGFGDAVRRSMASDPVEPQEVHGVRPDRTAFVLEVRGRVAVVDGRTVTVAEARDVTERVRARTETARLAAAVEQAAEAVVIVGLDGAVVYANAAFERISGYARDEIIGRDWRRLSSPERDRAAVGAILAAVAQGQPWSGVFVQRRKDGSLYQADSAISPVRDAAGRIINYLGIQRDVTRERDLEAQLRQAQKLEAVGQLATGIVHDLNNMLSVILANAELLSESLQDAAAESQRDLEDLRGAARGGAAMVRKLLAFSRQADLSFAPVDVRHVVEDLSGMLRRILPATIDVRLHAAEGLRPALADAGALQQIVLNLATNARDAMPDGGVIEIALEPGDLPAELAAAQPWVRPGPCTAVVVTDTGTGMDEKTLERVFEPFFTTKPPGKGTGLGMAMIIGLVKQHGGIVAVTSRPGHGTTVRVSLPCATARDSAPVRRPSGPTLRSGAETVLLVDDNEPLRRTGTRLLEKFGYRVLQAEDGAAALEVFAAHGPDIRLVISDLVMPRLGGRGLYDALRNRGAQVPFLFASGYGEAAMRSEMPTDARIFFAPKPWVPVELRAKVQEALDAGGP